MTAKKDQRKKRKLSDYYMIKDVIVVVLLKNRGKKHVRYLCFILSMLLFLNDYGNYYF